MRQQICLKGKTCLTRVAAHWIGHLLRPSPVRHHQRRRPQRWPDGAQPAGRPAALSDERRGAAGVRRPAGHAGRCALLQPGGGHRPGDGHPLPRHLHQHRWAVQRVRGSG